MKILKLTKTKGGFIYINFDHVISFYEIKKCTRLVTIQPPGSNRTSYTVKETIDQIVGRLNHGEIIIPEFESKK